MTSEETISADRWLRHLKRYIKVARAGIDPEGVHQVRVATRRLDVWLILGGWRIYRDDLRWLRGRASAVRDVDVLLGRKGLPRATRGTLIAWKREAQAEFIMACDDGRFSALMVGLAAMPPLKAEAVNKSLSRMAEGVMRTGMMIEEKDSVIESFHRLRRSARRFRYALEAVGTSTAPLKKLQEILGSVNDLAVAIRCLEGLPPEVIPPKFLESLHEQLAVLLPEARAQWLDHKSAINEMVG